MVCYLAQKENGNLKMKKTNMDRLFELFASEFVTVMIDKDVEQVTQTEESVSSMKSPISFVGFLTEIDDEYIYLGLDQNTINQAIKRNLIAHIELSDPNMFDEDNIPTPQNKGLN